MTSAGLGAAPFGGCETNGTVAPFRHGACSREMEPNTLIVKSIPPFIKYSRSDSGLDREYDHAVSECSLRMNFVSGYMA